MNAFRLVSAMFVGLVLITGCQEGDPANSDAEDKTQSDSNADAGKPSPTESSNEGKNTEESESSKQPVELTVATGDDLRKLIQQNKGKVILVDFWATFCAPCMENFPHIVDLAKKHDGDLLVISVSGDDPELSHKNALKFLQEQNATFPNLISKFGIGTETGESFQFPGGFPHYQLYDHTGKQRYNHTDFADDLNAEEWVGLEPIKTGGEEGEPEVNLLDKRVLELIGEKNADSKP